MHTVSMLSQSTQTSQTHSLLKCLVFMKLDSFNNNSAQAPLARWLSE